MEENNTKAIRRVLKKILMSFYVGGDGYHYSRLTESDYRMIEAALAEPLRNCDRFRDVNLAYKRFKSYVEKKNPSFTKNSPTHTVWDALKWALMPYEEKEVETK